VRYGIAIAISITLILAMFGFAAFMNMKEHQWKAANETLSAIPLCACLLAHSIYSYWYIFLSFLVAIPMSIVAITPERKEK
jgi:hypothetical protein